MNSVAYVQYSVFIVVAGGLVCVCVVVSGVV